MDVYRTTLAARHPGKPRLHQTFPVARSLLNDAHRRQTAEALPLGAGVPSSSRRRRSTPDESPTFGDSFQGDAAMSQGTPVGEPRLERGFQADLSVRWQCEDFARGTPGAGPDGRELRLAQADRQRPPASGRDVDSPAREYRLPGTTVALRTARDPATERGELERSGRRDRGGGSTRLGAAAPRNRRGGPHADRGAGAGGRDRPAAGGAGAAGARMDVSALPAPSMLRGRSPRPGWGRPPSAMRG